MLHTTPREVAPMTPSDNGSVMDAQLFSESRKTTSPFDKSLDSNLVHDVDSGFFPHPKSRAMWGALINNKDLNLYAKFNDIR